MSENLRSKHAFGSEANVDAALASGAIDAYDILFLNEKKIGWIDKNGNKIILDNKPQVVLVTELPETGEEGILYIYQSAGYIWNGTEFICISQTPGMEEVLSKITDEKIAAWDAAEGNAKTYADGLNTTMGEKVDGVDLRVIDLEKTIPTFLNKNQGVENQGKFMVVDETGVLTPQELDIATDEEIIDIFAESDMIMCVADSDGSILTDEENNIILW